MKKNKIILIAFTILVASFAMHSCCKKKGTVAAYEIIEFTIPFADSGNIPAIPISVPFDVPTDSFYSDLIPTYADSLFKQNNSSPDKVISVKAASMIISAYLTGQKIDFMKAIKLYIADKSGSNKILLGDNLDIPLGATNVSINLKDEELKRYIVADTFKIILGGTIRANANLSAGSALNFIAKFNVKANP